MINLDKHKVTIDGKEYNTYTIVKEDDINDKLELEEGTRSKFDSMSSIITLFVDNVKLGLAPQVNLSADMTVAATDLIALGIGQMRTLMIVNQPVLKYFHGSPQCGVGRSNSKHLCFGLLASCFCSH